MDWTQEVTRRGMKIWSWSWRSAVIRSRRNDIVLRWWNDSTIVIHWWDLSFGCVRLPPHRLLSSLSSSSFSSLNFLYPGPSTLPSSTSSNLDINPNSTSPKKFVPPSFLLFQHHLQVYLQKWERNIYNSQKCCSKDMAKEWLEFMERVNKRGFEMEGGKGVVCFF